MTQTKICGITSQEDALQSSMAGADYLGFLVDVAISEDKISRQTAKSIIKNLPLEVKPVLVTIETKAAPIIAVAEDINPAIIQLHGNISLEEIGKIRKALPRIKLTKTIPVTDEKALEQAKKYSPEVDFILLDSKTETKQGGTGKTHNWQISQKIVKAIKNPVFLAGGLNPENVKEAIKLVNPFAVDVNSGVKLKAGKKDIEKVISFIEKAKGE